MSENEAKYTMNPIRDFGMLVKTAREEREWTQRELAEKVGCNHTYISRIETGLHEARPAEETAVKIAQVLDIDPDEALDTLARYDPGLIWEMACKHPTLRAFLRRLQDEDFINDNEAGMADMIASFDRW